MKYAIPQDKLDKVVFRYLDMYYGDLENTKGEVVDIVFKKSNLDSEYGIMGWRKPDILFIHNKLVNEISGVFSTNEVDSKKVIGRWIDDRYQIEVNNTVVPIQFKFSGLRIDTKLN
jgi:hypothetical protein